MLEHTPLLWEPVHTTHKLILIVEADDMIGWRLLQTISQETPYHVLLASNGPAVFHVLRYIKPDLFLVDYRLPHMDGLQLSARLQAMKAFKDIPFLLFSGNVPLPEVATGGIVSLNKPFDLDHLLALLDTILAEG